jgi:glycosyltransferase involved in cell wall biosynthesis
MPSSSRRTRSVARDHVPRAQHGTESGTQISIIMPVYNCASFLASALDSMLAERDVALELIAINDGSTDDTLAILREAARGDARVIVLDQPNQGPALARNTGLQAARGQWVTFVDADDWVVPGTYGAWHRHACANDLDVLIGNGYRFTDDPRPETSSPLCHRQPWNQVMPGSDWIVRCAKHGEWPHYVWLQLIRRALIEQHGLRFVPGLMHEDILWTLQLALAAGRMGFAGQPAYGYRRNPDSIVNTPTQATVVRRAHSYIHILKTLVDTAAMPHGNAALRRALLRHANVEHAYFDQLLRKKLKNPASRREVASRFHDMKLWRPLWRGAKGLRQYRRLARSYLAVARFSWKARFARHGSRPFS